MSIRDEIVQNLSRNVSESINRVIIQSLVLAVGVENPNPYDYINRMSRGKQADGDMIFLDGRPLVWIGDHRIESDRVTVPYTII